MPRKPAPGRRWVSVEIDESDYLTLKEAARIDRRSLAMFLRIELGKVAADHEFDDLLDAARIRDEQAKAGSVQEQSVQEQSPNDAKDKP